MDKSNSVASAETSKFSNTKLAENYSEIFIKKKMKMKMTKNIQLHNLKRNELFTAEVWFYCFIVAISFVDHVFAFIWTHVPQNQTMSSTVWTTKTRKFQWLNEVANTCFRIMSWLVVQRCELLSSLSIIIKFVSII